MQSEESLVRTGNTESASCASLRALPQAWARSLCIAMASLLLASGALCQTNIPSYSNSPTPTAPQAQSPYFQSVPSQPVPGVLEISLLDAIDRGLKHNLGLLVADDATLDARGKRWQELSHLLPNVNGTVGEHLEQINLAAEGISFSGVPTIVGPFGYFDARAFYSQPIIDLHAINNVRSESQNIRAAQYTNKDARELVVLVVGLNYLQTISDAARLDTAQAQTQTAQALYDQAADQLKAGTSASIDALRAQVELQTQQQQVIAARNILGKQKLALARVIGLAPGQEFRITDTEPYDAYTPAGVEVELQKAYTLRSDYKSAEAKVRAAEYALKAAKEQYLPSVRFDADYGDIGVNPSNSHGTVDVAGTLKIPIFDGGQTHGDVLRTQATLKQNLQQLENIKAQIDQDVRDALLDLQSAAQQVQVARSNNDLANQTLAQAKDRFAAGVTNNIEVVQAQQSVASASESYISSLFNYNYAKISLARAIGSAEQSVKDYLKGRQ
jgi:outer membrane protein TolC